MLMCDDTVKLGTRVKVESCEALTHGSHKWCVCELVGMVVIIEKRYWTKYNGTSSYRIRGSNKLITQKEFTVLKNQRTATV